MNKPAVARLSVRTNKLFLTVICLCSLIFPAGLTAGPDESYPAPKGYVSDYAGILSQQAVRTADSIAKQVEELTRAQITVLIVNTTKPLEIEQYAAGLFEKWGIGQKGEDNGILLLFAMADRGIRIETGYGIEDIIPDAVASNVIHGVIIPQFRQGHYEKGVLAGLLAVSDLIAREYNVNLNLDKDMSAIRQETAGRLTPLSALAYLLLFIFIFGMRSGLLFYFLLGPNGRRRGGYWYGSGGFGGGFGSGFGGFGGGMSGGGGASGQW
ncbi:MAG: TPM domain-containing protein [Candidatus Omnitrophota bacterium]